MAELNCIVVTPEETALEQQADFIALPLYDGELGIAPGHSPMIGRLGCGEMRLKSAGQVASYYVDGGFVQVADDLVAVLTSRAVPADQIDAEVAQEQLATSLGQTAHSPELIDARARNVDQSRAMLRVAKKATNG